MFISKEIIEIEKENLRVEYKKNGNYLTDIIFFDRETYIEYPLDEIIERHINCVKIAASDTDSVLSEISVWSESGIRYEIMLYNFSFTRHIEGAPKGLYAVYKEYSRSEHEAIYINEDEEFLYYASSPIDFPKQNIVKKNEDGEYVFRGDYRYGERKAATFFDAAIQYLEEYTQGCEYSHAMSIMHGLYEDVSKRRK